MFKFFKKLKLRQGVLTIEYGLILSFVITIGYFFISENGPGQYINSIIAVERINSYAGYNRLGGSGDVPESQPEIKDSDVIGIVRDAVENIFSKSEYEKNQGESFSDIVWVNIVAHEDGTREIQFSSSIGTDVKWKPANSYFKGQHEEELLVAMKDVPTGKYKIKS